MSYKLYIGGFEMELKDINRLAQTKQRNNITNLHQRQSNASNNFALPRTPKNVNNMEFLGIVGNKSTRPYSKLPASLQDTETGEWLIYDGWANISATDKDFKVTIVDGAIDFYKAIENKTLTDVNLSALSHVKSLTNITTSWANNLPYMYILADFNGNNYSSTGIFNIDFQVPSARISYIWDRIHQFAGFTYSGTIFQSQKFLNLFMTFPKPVPTTGTNYVNIETHNTGIANVPYSYWSGNVLFQGNKDVVVTFPTAIPSTAYFQVVNNRYVFLQAGVFKLGITGGVTITTVVAGLFTETTTVTIMNYFVRNSAGTLISNGQIDSSGLGYVILNLNVGDQVSIFSYAEAGGGLWPGTLSGAYTIKLDVLTGYVVNFDDVLVDFLATDFVKEVLNHFALTPYKDKYSNHIEYKTLKEIIQDPDVVDWSDKKPVRLSEKYIIGSYGQSNVFTWKYDRDELEYNDGSILIDNKNLKERTVVVQSRFYTPSLETVTLNTKPVHVYKLWEKEINDAGVVEYKELTGRFYLLRQTSSNTSITITSVATSQTTTYSGQIPYASNFRLNWKGLLLDNYSQMTQILNTSKMVEANLYLTSKDVSDFDFKRLVYIEQFSSYYLVNRIVNYIKNKYTKVELLEVDYYTEDDGINYVIPYTFITITNATAVGCVITVNFTTDATLPINVSAEVIQSSFGGAFGNTIVATDVYVVNATSGTIVFTFTGIIAPFVSISLRLWLGSVGFGLQSTNAVNLNLSGCVIPNQSTFINLVSLQTIAIIPQMILNTRRVQVTFTSDLPLPNTIRFWYNGGMFGGGQQYQDLSITSNVFTVDIPHDTLGFFGGGTVLTTWICYLQAGTIVSNQLTSSS